MPNWRMKKSIGKIRGCAGGRYALRTLCFSVFCLLSVPPLKAFGGGGGQNTLRLSVSADTVIISAAEVKGYRSTLRGEPDGTVRWKMRGMEKMPQILSNADPMHYVRFLPGVQMENEGRSGLHIYGCESAHNQIDIAGAPVYNVNHLLGLFSTFHSSHFSEMQLNKTASRADAPGRIGGTLSMLPFETRADTLSGRIDVGLISSQASLRMPAGSRSSLTISGRTSYLNRLYSPWLRQGESVFRYRFTDVNATWNYRPAARHLILFDVYAGGDRARFDEQYYAAGMKARWGNVLANLRWRYDGRKVQCAQTLYYTRYANRFSLNMEGMNGTLPSAVEGWGYHADLQCGFWQMGVQAVANRFRPQWPQLNDKYHESRPEPSRSNSAEAAVYVNRRVPLNTHIDMEMGLRAGGYAHRSTRRLHLDPSCALTGNWGDLTLRAAYALRHQYLHKSGFSDAGLPTEFWVPADSRKPPQYAHGISLTASSYLFQRRYFWSVDLFWKKLAHQLEYNGSMLDFLNQTYDIDAPLIHGQGRNMGIGVMFQKCTGVITGWIGYTFTHARRTFTDYMTGTSFPASHERPHECNAVVTWNCNRHWSFGLAGAFASGTPFTAPSSVSVLNGNLIVDYGAHNANRLPAYFRLDLSANYQWSGKWIKRHALNFSLYNATNRSNHLFYSLKVRKNGDFYYGPTTFMLGLLPSLSYGITF